MEREIDRRERRRLLDLSVSKIQGANVPLRKHLLVYNAAKVLQVCPFPLSLPSLILPSLQKDLDALDEEDLYATLMEPLHSTMEVDHWAVFSEETLRKGGDKEEKMEVEEKEITPNIWQWMEKSEEQHTNQLSNHQVRRGILS